MDLWSILIGAAIANAIWYICTRRKPVREPEIAPEPFREGDVVCRDIQPLPVLLLKQLTYNSFEGCYITPHAENLGAKIKNSEPIGELVNFLVLSTDGGLWKKYQHELTDLELANIAKKRLTDAGG